MSGTNQAQTPVTFALTNLTAPASMTTNAVKLAFVLSAAETISYAMSGAQQTLGNFTAQAMSIDNTDNDSAVTVSEQVFGWSRIIPAGTYRTFQFPGISLPVFNFTSAGGGTIDVSLYDWPAFPDESVNEAIASSSVTVVGTAAVAIMGTLPPPTPGTYVQPGTTMVTGGTAVVAIPAAAIVNEGRIGNPPSNTATLFVNGVTTAGTSAVGSNWELLPGQSIPFRPTSTAVSVNATGSVAVPFNVDIV